MPKPLKVSENVSNTLPMDEIRRSIAGYKMKMWVRPPDRTLELTPFEHAMLDSAFRLFSADPTQHTFQNVHDVACYLWIAFGHEDTPVPQTYDWRVIDSICESQMLATLTLYGTFTSRLYKKGNKHEHAMAGMAAKGLPMAAALFQAETLRAKNREGARTKLARDPKQAAKAEAFKLWQERNGGKHPKLRRHEDFATECMRRWPVLKSAKVILGWCTEWNKTAKAQKS